MNTAQEIGPSLPPWFSFYLITGSIKTVSIKIVLFVLFLKMHIPYTDYSLTNCGYVFLMNQTGFPHPGQFSYTVWIIIICKLVTIKIHSVRVESIHVRIVEITPFPVNGIRTLLCVKSSTFLPKINRSKRIY